MVALCLATAGAGLVLVGDGLALLDVADAAEGATAPGPEGEVLAVDVAAGVPLATVTYSTLRGNAREATVRAPDAGAAVGDVLPLLVADPTDPATTVGLAVTSAAAGEGAGGLEARAGWTLLLGTLALVGGGVTATALLGAKVTGESDRHAPLDNERVRLGLESS